GYRCDTGTINQEIVFVTVVDVRCARGAKQFGIDIRPIVRRLRRGLRGYNYIGLIEPGLYSNITKGHANLSRSRWTSWQLHALVWGVSQQEMKELIRRLNKSGEYIPITPEQMGAHGERAWEGGFSSLIGYMLKPPTFSYRVGVDREHQKKTGEIRHRQFTSK